MNPCKMVEVLGKSASAVALFALVACSPAPDSSSSQADPLPTDVVGYAQWGDGDVRDIHRVRCRLDPPFYAMQAEGHGFEVRVGFWGQDADRIDQVDFDQADSVELKRVDEEEQIYRYTTLRVLPEMGDVSGSTSRAAGKTGLRPTSLAALEEDADGIELDFEFSCPVSDPAPGAES